MTDRCRDQDPAGKTTMFWLQPGGQRIGDQLFNAFAYSEQKKSFISSSKAESRNGLIPYFNGSIVLWVALSSSLFGFACQFVGLRGLHGSVALYQLAITLCMTIVRALLRSRRLGAENNNLRKQGGIEGHELDWQALNLQKEDDELPR
jgi:hypothetical protein